MWNSFSIKVYSQCCETDPQNIFLLCIWSLLNGDSMAKCLVVSLSEDRLKDLNEASVKTTDS